MWLEKLSRAIESHSDSFNNSYQILKDMKNQNLEREYVYQLLTTLREKYKTNNDEKKEDLILELMDVVSGFCTSNLKLW